jgi:hypothetical protein
MRTPHRFQLLLGILLILSACDRFAPAGFWTRFENGYLVENRSGQGPWGGYRVLHWKATTRGHFSAQRVRDFVGEKGWKLVDSLRVQTLEIKKWLNVDRPIFPLSNRGFTPDFQNNGTYERFPLWIKTNLFLYRFETGWVLYDPGTNTSTEQNGFVLIKSDGTEMSVYHLWGE